MTFQSLSFLVFLPAVLAVCFLTGKKHPRLGTAALTAASAVFYLWSFKTRAFLGFGVLAAGTAVSFLAGRALSGERTAARRRGILTAAICWHTAVLLIFKYTGFFTGGAADIGWAPLGLSFFTFQQIWYLKEVYTGQFEAQAASEFVLYAFFFPAVSSGPIMRPGSFFPQLRGEKFLHPDWQDAAAGLYALAVGMAKKVILADSFSIIVNNGWTQIRDLSAPAAWLVILGYTLQLYFDFSGYCDMAAGAARMLGICLPVNFDSPYRSLSIGEFWKRWHITLTTFLRECVYFPLGGSKKGTLRTYLNILAIFLISGFWHGAGWTFIFWGLFHGICQVIERIWGKRREKLPVLLRWAATFLLVNVAWVFFRAPSLPQAFELLRAGLCGGWKAPDALLFTGAFKSEAEAVGVLIPALKSAGAQICTAALYGAGLLAVLLPGNTIRRMDAFRPTFWRGVLICLLFAWTILSFTGITTFIYANF